MRSAFLGPVVSTSTRQMLVQNTVLETSKKKHLPSLTPQEKKMAPWAQGGNVGPYEAQKGPTGPCCPIPAFLSPLGGAMEYDD